MLCKLLAVKWQVFLSILNFMQKCQFCVKKIAILGEMLTFHLVSTTIKSDHLFAKHAYLKNKKMWRFCEGLYTVTNCLVLVKKNFNFLQYIKLYVVILLENWYFDSKYFVQWYFGQKCHFPNKIYILFFGQIEQFFEKGVN